MVIIQDDIKALIFDLDGTLADTMPLHLKSWVEVGEYFDVDITEELINEYLGTPTVDLVNIFNARFNWGLEPQKVRERKQWYYDRNKEEQGKIKAVQPIWEIAKSMRGKLPMSIATGSSRVNALRSIDDIGTSDWWECIYTGSDDVPGKPHPDIFLACAEYMKVSPQHCLVFEDGPSGMEGAKKAGMKIIDVNKLLADLK